MKERGRRKGRGKRREWRSDGETSEGCKEGRINSDVNMLLS